MRSSNEYGASRISLPEALYLMPANSRFPG
jgi:hypothetical protein